MVAAAPPEPSPGVGLPDPLLAARGLAVVRILFGAVFAANGFAKLFGVHRVAFGPYVGNLIDREDTRFILNAETNVNAQHDLPFLRTIVNDLLLPNFSFFQWLITATEITAGVLLLVGLASRLGALIALGPVTFLAYMYLANDRWVPEQPLELIPLLVLAIVPTGRVWGLDGRLAPARRAGRWPF